MPILTTLLAAAATALPSACEWKDPGRDPFMGNVPAAIDVYKDIPADVRARLKDRMSRHVYDDFVEIQRDTIAGTHDYDPEITGMHFGARGRRCATITRDSWRPDHREHGLVYCDSGHCILVPTVCRNVSRIVRRPDATPVAELEFEPPGAGPLETDEAPPGWPVVSLRTEPPLESFGPPGAGESETPWPSWPGGGVGGGLPMEPTVPRSPPAPPVMSPVPEPGAGVLAALGAAIVFWRRRRR